MRYLLTCGFVACLCWSMATAQTYDFDALKKAPGESKPAEVVKPTARKAEPSITAAPAISHSNSVSTTLERNKQLFLDVSEHWISEFNSKNYAEAHRLAIQLLDVSGQAGMSKLSNAEAHRALALVLVVQGFSSDATTEAEQALAIFQEAGEHEKVASLVAEFNSALNQVDQEQAEHQTSDAARQPDPPQQPDQPSQSLPDADSTSNWWDGIVNPQTILAILMYLAQGLAAVVEFVKRGFEILALRPEQTPLEMLQTFLMILLTSLSLALLIPWLLKVLARIIVVLVHLVSLPFYLLYAVVRFTLGMLIRYWYFPMIVVSLAVIEKLSEGAITHLVEESDIWHLVIVAAVLLFFFGKKGLRKHVH